MGAHSKMRYHMIKLPRSNLDISHYLGACEFSFAIGSFDKKTVFAFLYKL